MNYSLMNLTVVYFGSVLCVLGIYVYVLNPEKGPQKSIRTVLRQSSRTSLGHGHIGVS